MSLKLYEESSIQAIANSIRAKNGSSDTYTVAEMSTAIDNIPAGGTVYEESWLTGLKYTLTADGTLKVTATSDTYMGKSEVIKWICYCIKKVDATDPHILGTAQDEGFMYFNANDIPSKNLNIQFEFGENFRNIRNNAFRNAPIASFTIPSTVKNISASAFNNSKLTSITIPANVEDMGDYVFGSCAQLQTATIAESNQTYAIMAYTFEYCTALTTVLIQNKATAIYQYAFRGCTSLTSVTLPNTITTIERGVFQSCTALQTIDVSSATAIKNDVFNGCTSLQTINASSATEIGNYTFYGCTSLQTVDVSSITTIGNNAFRSCTSLQTIDISTATTIDGYAFMDCTALTSIDISSVVDVGYETFYGCNNLVETVGTPGVFTIPDTLTTTRGDFLCLRNGQTPHLTTVVVGTGLTTTTDWMFGRQTALQSVTFNGVMTSIHSNTFINCTQSGLTIYFPNMTTAQVSALSGYSSKWGATNATIICSDT